MEAKKKTPPETFEFVYRRLEEVMLANSGENEFEEIFKIVVLKVWEDVTVSNTVDNLESANRLLVSISDIWRGVLVETKLNITAEQFAICADITREFNFSEEGYEGIDGIFEYIISREKKGSKGQFFTPRYIVDFCVKILNPKRGEKIIDPAAGSGAFLYHSFLHGSDEEKKLWGFDFDNIAVRVARLLMYVGGVNSFHICKVNSLIKKNVRISLLDKNIGENSTTIEDILRIEKDKGLFDVVITNPPFAGEIIEPDILQSYHVSYGKPKIERDVLFVERCIELLKPGGRMGIVLPDNIFGGKENEKLRKWVYANCRIVGVIGIPRNAFMPHTAVKTSVLFLEKRISERQRDEKIFFGISEKPGKDSRGKLIFKSDDNTSWTNVEHDLDEIHDEFVRFLDNEKIGW